LTFPRATLSLGEWHGREAIQGDSQEAEHVILRLCARRSQWSWLTGTETNRVGHEIRGSPRCCL